MNPQAMEPFGMALRAYFEGDTTAELIIRRDDGLKSPLPVSFFFRDPSGFTSIDHAALERCMGHVLDVRATEDPENLAYHEANCQAGRYVGEIRMQFEYQGRNGPYCGWLHIDPDTLKEHAAKQGWDCEVLMEEASGDYLARLNNGRPA